MAYTGLSLSAPSECLILPLNIIFAPNSIRMVNFQFLETNKERLRSEYLFAKPFPYLIVDDFCDISIKNNLFGSETARNQ